MVMVSSHVRDGTASMQDQHLYTVKDGSFVSLMPKIDPHLEPHDGEGVV